MALIWQVDDTERWHEVTRRTVALLGGRFQLVGFADGDSALAAWRTTAADQLPDIVLMDFFLGAMHGDALTRAMRRFEPRQRRSCIVGHSSIVDRSEQIRGSGGDAVVRKHADAQGVNPSLLRWLQVWSGER